MCVNSVCPHVQIPITTSVYHQRHSVTPAEVLKLLNSLPSSKTSSSDIIPVFVLKSCSHFFAPILAQLANMSFSEGIFPTSFKHADVPPLLKSPVLDPSEPFRPISNIRTIGKVLDCLIHPQFTSHLSQSLLPSLSVWLSYELFN